MTTYHIVSGLFAETFCGNMTTHWLPEGDDLQERANNARMKVWIDGSGDCPIYRRNMAGHIVCRTDGEQVGNVLYTRPDAAEKALAAYQTIA